LAAALGRPEFISFRVPLLPGMMNSFGAMRGAVVTIGGAGGLLFRPLITGGLNDFSLDATGGLKDLLPSAGDL
jgi:hypothetical protein